MSDAPRDGMRVYRETDEERAKRIAEAADKYALRFTPGQREMLRRASERR